MNIGTMTNQELEDYLVFLSKEIERIVHDYVDVLPNLQDTMRAVAHELSLRSPV